MNKTRFVIIAAAFGMISAAPALAQMQNDSMSKSSMSASPGMTSSGMHMSKSSMMAMHKCQAMSHGMMMKNKKCAGMMKMHKGMMQSGKM